MASKHCVVLALVVLGLAGIVTGQSAPAYICADVQPDGTIANLHTGCPMPTPGDNCGYPHQDPDRGTKRVILTAWPSSSQVGPFKFSATGVDRVTKITMGNAVGVAPTTSQKLQAVTLNKESLVMALGVRQSSAWLLLTLAQQQAVQKIIDDAGAQVLTGLNQ